MGSCCGKSEKKSQNENAATGNLPNYKVAGSSNTLSDKSIIHSVVDKQDLLDQLAAAADNLVVLDFHAVWCRPCTMVAPKIEAFANEFTDIIFLKVDVNDCEDIAAEYGIETMPTFIFIRKSAKLEEFFGVNIEKLKDRLKALK